MMRRRKHLVQTAGAQKRKIHAVLLAGSMRIGGTPFSKVFVQNVRELDDYHMNDHLDMMDGIAARYNLRSTPQTATNHHAVAVS